MLKQVKLYRITILILFITFLYSTYKAYEEYGYEKFESNNPPSIVIEKNSDIFYAQKENNLTLVFNNIPNYRINKSDLTNLVLSLNKNCKIIGINILNEQHLNFRGADVVSFKLIAKIISDSCSEEFPIIDNYTFNSKGEKYSVTGVFPEIKEIGTYAFTLSKDKVNDGDNFEIELKLENVDPINNITAIDLYSPEGIKPPKAIGNAIIRKTEGVEGKLNYSEKQIFLASSPGVFKTKYFQLKLKNKTLKIVPYQIKVNRVIPSYDVNYNQPKSINDNFYIEVNLYNVTNDNPKPIFPNIRDSRKNNLEEKINRI